MARYRLNVRMYRENYSATPDIVIGIPGTGPAPGLPPDNLNGWFSFNCDELHRQHPTLRYGGRRLGDAIHNSLNLVEPGIHSGSFTEIDGVYKHVTYIVETIDDTTTRNETGDSVTPYVPLINDPRIVQSRGIQNGEDLATAVLAHIREHSYDMDQFIDTLQDGIRHYHDTQNLQPFNEDTTPEYNDQLADYLPAPEGTTLPDTQGGDYKATYVIRHNKIQDRWYVIEKNTRKVIINALTKSLAELLLRILRGIRIDISQEQNVTDYVGIPPLLIPYTQVYVASWDVEGLEDDDIVHAESKRGPEQANVYVPEIYGNHNETAPISVVIHAYIEQELARARNLDSNASGENTA